MFKIGIPNKGSLSEGAVKILSEAGYNCKRHSRELIVRDAEHNVEFIFLRPRDIAVYVGNGIVNAGITGRDLAQDSGAPVQEHLALGIGKSRFCYAAPKGKGLTPEKLEGMRIATSYPRIVRDDMEERGVTTDVVRLDGAVEISIRLEVADAIADVVESGRTLHEAGLEIIGQPVMHSEAILIRRADAPAADSFYSLIKRLEGILVAREYVLLEYVVPKKNQEKACEITPGVKSPTLSPVSEPDWVSIAAMVKNRELNRIIDDLSRIEAKGIIAHSIKTCRL